jgi:hypothetical protein
MGNLATRTMIEVVYSPEWFYGKDIAIDIVSIIVLLLIGFFSIRYYRLDRKNRNYLSLGASFLLLASAFIFKVLTNFTIYYHELEVQRVGLSVIAYQTVEASYILFYLGFLLHRMMFLFGLYVLYSIYQPQEKPNIVLMVYFIFISAYFSEMAYYVFHITALVFLFFITLQYYRNYRENRMPTSRMLLASFLAIAVSQLLFVFVEFSQTFYVIAEFIQLAGYIVLLLMLVTVLRHGKKKKQD